MMQMFLPASLCLHYFWDFVTDLLHFKIHQSVSMYVDSDSKIDPSLCFDTLKEFALENLGVCAFFTTVALDWVKCYYCF